MHDCVNCGGACYCHGDIDDCAVETEEFAWEHCEGCGCTDDIDDTDMTMTGGPQVASCIGCGCDDFHACGHGCWWMRVDYAAGLGVCSQCPEHIEAWDRGDRTSHAVPAAVDEAIRSGAIRFHRPEQPRPAYTDGQCQHDWPFEDVQDSDTCRWCGMSFVRHVFTELP